MCRLLQRQLRSTPYPDAWSGQCTYHTRDVFRCNRLQSTKWPLKGCFRFNTPTSTSQSYQHRGTELLPLAAHTDSQTGPDRQERHYFKITKLNLLARVWYHTFSILSTDVGVRSLADDLNLIYSYARAVARLPVDRKECTTDNNCCLL
jgi:hypothetical protein